MTVDNIPSTDGDDGGFFDDHDSNEENESDFRFDPPKGKFMPLDDEFRHLEDLCQGKGKTRERMARLLELVSGEPFRTQILTSLGWECETSRQSLADSFHEKLGELLKKLRDKGPEEIDWRREEGRFVPWVRQCVRNLHRTRTTPRGVDRKQELFVEEPVDQPPISEAQAQRSFDLSEGYIRELPDPIDRELMWLVLTEFSIHQSMYGLYRGVFEQACNMGLVRPTPDGKYTTKFYRRVRELVVGWGNFFGDHWDKE